MNIGNENELGDDSYYSGKELSFLFNSYNLPWKWLLR